MDISQAYGNDFDLSVHGDLLTIDGEALTQQRIIKRLLTNPGSLLAHLDYGAGLGRYVGNALSSEKFNEIKALIISQMQLESRVAKSPKPQVTLSITSTGYLDCHIVYYDAQTNQQYVLTFTVEP